ncbi:MAG TPA: TfuA-related McrA-glycine thioamidation protein [Methanocorpusculum sp.]|nr:TfuA-related McrA-glycine thioamidation protein [Methanocorpusculum sp.]
MVKITVFLGPSLPVEEARKYLPDAEYLPPVKRGDAALAASNGTEVMVIIDGVFFQDESVGHKEILGVIKQGISVYGSSSMGALRACELEPFGMVGVGTVFNWYKSGKIIADDEVGLLYDPETGMALSEPLVNIRATLTKAVAEGIVSADEEQQIIRAGKSVYYPDRTYRRILKESELPQDRCTVLLSWLKTNTVDQKREDAIACLSLVRDTYAAK